jgi:tetratricopeptide (TPR) repeat protein
MWLVPVDPEVLRHGTCHLRAGRYPLPWYHTPRESSRFAHLLSRLLPDVLNHVEVHWDMLPLPGTKLVNGGTTLVVVRMPPGISPTMAAERLNELGGLYQLVQYAEPVHLMHGESYFWQADVKQSIGRMIRRNVARSEHPLANLGVKYLPVQRALKLTSDVAVFLDILDRTITHRLEFIQNGSGRAEYEHSLRHVIGEMLAWRLMRIGPDLLPACAQTLIFGMQPDAESWHDVGAALQQVGLGRFSDGDFAPAPMVKALEDSVTQGVFLETLRTQSLAADTSITQYSQLSLPSVPTATTTDDSPEPGPFDTRSGDRLWHEVISGLQAVLGAIDAGALRDSNMAHRLPHAVYVLEALTVLTGYAQDVEPELTQQVVKTLRSLGRTADLAEAEPLRRVVERLLRFHASRGPGRLVEREKAFNGLFNDVDQDAPEIYRLAMGAACADLGWDLVRTAADGKTMDKAERLCADALSLCPKRSAARASLLGVLAQIQEHRGDYEHALVLHEERQNIYRNLSAIREQAVTWTRMARIYANRGDLEDAETLHYRALAVFEQHAAEHDRAVALGDIARIKGQRGDEKGALQMHRKRLETLKNLGAEHSVAIALGDVARLLAGQGQLDDALSMHQERLQLFEALNHVQGVAIAKGDIARIKAARGEYDEALVLHRARLKTFEALEDLDGVAITRLNIGQIEARRGHAEQAQLELRTAYALNQQLGHAKGIATSGESLARLLAEMGGSGAVPPLEDAIAQYDRLGMTDKVDELSGFLDRVRAAPAQAAETEDEER